MHNFPGNLKVLRKEKNISQTELSKLLKVSLKTISHWETGYSEPSIDQIVFLAKFFNISADDLLGL